MTIAQVIEHWQGLPFEWGTLDCCQFVGSCIESVTGENAAEFYDYDGEAEAQALIEEAGDLVALVSQTLGDPVERAPQENDVVLVNDGSQDILGFVWAGRVILRTKGGLVDWPLDRARNVWCLKPPPQ